MCLHSNPVEMKRMHAEILAVNEIDVVNVE